VDSLQVVINALRDYDVADEQLTVALRKITGNDIVTTAPETWQELNHSQMELAIVRLSGRLEQFDADSAKAALELDTHVGLSTEAE
jgi:hypothetical protein